MLGLATVIGLVAPAAVSAAPAVAPATDVTTLVVVPPEPAPAPIVIVTPVPAATLIEADVIEAPVAAAPAPTPTPAPARVAGSQVEAPAQPEGSSSTGVADAHAVSNDRSYRTSSLRIEIAATDSAHRTATIRSSTGGVIAGPFNVDGQPIELDGLDAGDVDLVLEDATEDAGSTMSRTPISLRAGERHVARCDTVTLDCTVS